MGVSWLVEAGGQHSLVEVDATVGELAERSLLLQLCMQDATVSRYPIFLPLRSLHTAGFCLLMVAYRRPPRRSMRCQYRHHGIVLEEAMLTYSASAIFAVVVGR